MRSNGHIQCVLWFHNDTDPARFRWKIDFDKLPLLIMRCGRDPSSTLSFSWTLNSGSSGSLERLLDTNITWKLCQAW